MRSWYLPVSGRRRLWLVVSATLLALSFAGILIRGLNLSIEFTGGTSFVLDGVAADTTAEGLRVEAEAAGAEEAAAQLQLDGDQPVGATVRTDALEPGSDAAVAVSDALVAASEAQDVEVSFVGPSWGRQISIQALQALVVFLVVVVLYISLRLEFKMAIAALLALFHDLVITIGLYALIGFSFTPSTAIAILTILGFSLYDTVVVFDRVQENETFIGDPGRRTYVELVDTSVNEVLVRSFNTAVAGILPVAALLFIGTRLLGASTLEDLALALLLGEAVGVYSSLLVASPFYAWWKEREPDNARRSERLRAAIAAGDEPATVSLDAITASRAPITTDYVRGAGKAGRKRGKR